MHSTLTTKRTAGIRSTNGCWTCRLRRKKCDETQPECQTCANLGVDCGYGPRPPWMDRGPLEREKAYTVKAEIAHAGSKRRRISLSNKSLSTKPSLTSPKDDFPGPRQTSTYHFEEVRPFNNPQIMPKPLPNPPWEDIRNLTDNYFGLISPNDDLLSDGIMPWQNRFLSARRDGGNPTISPLEMSSNKSPFDQCSLSSELYLGKLRSSLPVNQNENRLSGDVGQAINGGRSTQLEGNELQTDFVFPAPNSLGFRFLGLENLLSSPLDNSSSASSLEINASNRTVNL
ncbi:hypothetical protein BJ170DRAFT_177113 [Xylariales sp. AK1849]|nr:hypothetical protein BJ170DRAFT_177113 [Xylariales sp. AK1849]